MRNDMRRFFRLTLSTALLVLVAVGLVGCDDSPTSIQDFDVQPQLDTPGGVSLVLAEGSASFGIQYQGLDSHPQASGTGELQVSKASESGSPAEGEQEWTITYGQSTDGVVTENVVFQSSSGSRQITDTVSVTISRFVITSSFTNDFIAVADYEDDQRSLSTSGGTSVVLDSTNVSDRSNGLASLQVDATQGGSATISRRASAAGADRFTFLVLPASSDFTLTFTFTEETGGGTTEHQVEVPISAGSEWLKYGINLDQIAEDFNPVASRAGGNGPLVSIEMSADQGVTYNVDELYFENVANSEVIADIHDFEQTSLAYGPPFCPPTFGSSSAVADSSDGFTARTVEGAGCFGYNYNGISLDLESNDVVSFRVNGAPGSELEVFVEAGGEGGFGTGSSVVRSVETNGWERITIPLSELGDDPSALSSPGLSNVGFTSEGSDPDFAIDDVRIETANN